MIAVAVVATGVMISRSIPPKSELEKATDALFLSKPEINGQSDKADIRTAQVQIGGLASSLKMYAVDMKSFPLTEEGLEVLISPPEDEALAKKWDGPYIEGGKLPNDPWGTPFNYTYDNDKPRVWSSGPDKKAGTLDDIEAEKP